MAMLAAPETPNSEYMVWFFARTEIGNTGEARPRFIDTARCVSPAMKALNVQGAGSGGVTPFKGWELRMRSLGQSRSTA